jgi:hypothetical protein
MLLALVCIAALLVPLHHKLEKWATNKLVEKNKAIRLVAAKRTIEELETGEKLSKTLIWSLCSPIINIFGEYNRKK